MNGVFSSSRCWCGGRVCNTDTRKWFSVNCANLIWGRGNVILVPQLAQQKGKRAPSRMVQLCLGQPLLHLGIRHDMSREFFDLNYKIFRLRDVSGEGSVRSYSYLVEARADVGAHDEFDALDFGLDEHDPRVLRFGRVGVPA